MGRCQSTPGLVETVGRVPLEEMWLSTAVAQSTMSTQPPPAYSSQQSGYRYSLIEHNNILKWFSNKYFFSRTQSPKSHHGESSGTERPVPPIEDSGSMSPSANSSEERPRSRATSRPQSQPSRSGEYLNK